MSAEPLFPKMISQVTAFISHSFFQSLKKLLFATSLSFMAKLIIYQAMTFPYTTSGPKETLNK